MIYYDSTDEVRSQLERHKTFTEVLPRCSRDNRSCDDAITDHDYNMVDD